MLDEGQGAPGTLLDDHLTITCSEGAVRLIRIQRAGKKSMSVQAFLNGVTLKSGMVLD